MGQSSYGFDSRCLSCFVKGHHMYICNVCNGEKEYEVCVCVGPCETPCITEVEICINCDDEGRVFDDYNDYEVYCAP